MRLWGDINVTLIKEKMTGNLLRWFRHVKKVTEGTSEESRSHDFWPYKKCNSRNDAKNK